MPTYDRVHLKSCLANAVRSAVENLRDNPDVSHLAFHNVINGGDYRGDTLYSLAYIYLECGMVQCTCGAVPTHATIERQEDPRLAALDIAAEEADEHVEQHDYDPRPLEWHAAMLASLNAQGWTLTRKEN